MGKSNQARTLKYYLWIENPDPGCWFVAKIPPRNRRCFEIYDYTEYRWVKYKEDFYNDLFNPKDDFYCDHIEISEDKAMRCVIGGPEYCRKVQKEIRKRAKKTT